MTELVGILFGTRPELIKLAPLIRLARREFGHSSVYLISSGQHDSLLEQAMSDFDIQPDVALSRESKSTNLNALLSQAVRQIGEVIQAKDLKRLVVQGDTTTALAGGLAMAHEAGNVYHVEAGLRTNDLNSPFPEELNRQLIARLAKLHFAPTESARRNLLREGILSETIQVCGNTGIDAVALMLERFATDAQFLSRTRASFLKRAGLQGFGQGLVTVTVHRRENWGTEGVSQLMRAFTILAKEYADWQFVFPLHPNPQLRMQFQKLAELPNFHISEPLPYAESILALNHSQIVLTDSGGIQEECAALGAKTIVLREMTERQEVLDYPDFRIAGQAEDKIVACFRELAQGDQRCPSLNLGRNPFGDGTASRKICDSILR